MATNTLFDIAFTTYTVGATNITGFYNVNGVSNVVDLGTMTGSSSATGFFERTGHALHLAEILHQETTEVPASQVTWAGFGPGINMPITAVDNAAISSGTVGGATYIPIAAIFVNDDYTASFVTASTQSGGLYSGSAYIQTTTQQVIYPYTWQYFQVNWGFDSVIIASNTYLTVTCTFGIEGTTVINATATTATQINSLYTADADMNQWRFFCQGGAGYLDAITCITVNGTDTLPPIGTISGTTTISATWPHPGSPLHARFTEAAVEVARGPTNFAGRLTQGAVEVSRQPTTRFARYTQGVVEIIRRVTPSNTWYVYEA